MELLIVLTVFLTVLVLALALVRRRDHLSQQQLVLDRAVAPAGRRAAGDRDYASNPDAGARNPGQFVLRGSDDSHARRAPLAGRS